MKPRQGLTFVLCATLSLCSGLVVLIVDRESVLDHSTTIADLESQARLLRETRGSQTQLEETARFAMESKSHFYDPATAQTAHGLPLKWFLAPFHPTHDEFQAIAKYETALMALNDATSEALYQSPEGKFTWMASLDKLDQELRATLGSERYDRLEYTTGFESHFSAVWRVLDVNGVAEDRTEELRQLAESYTLEVFGETLDLRAVEDNWHPPEYDEELAIKSAYREEVRRRFGQGVLTDILTVPNLDIFNGLGWGEGEEASDPWLDPELRARIEVDYKVVFEESPEPLAPFPFMDTSKEQE